MLGSIALLTLTLITMTLHTAFRIVRADQKGAAGQDGSG
jgi:hypothetical protein